MEAMRAFQVPEPGQPFRLVRRGIPQPAAHQVRVRVQACGICHSDIFAISGIPGAQYPLTPGHEIAGIVDATGATVQGWRAGDRVGIGWFGGHCGECESCRRGTFVTCSGLRAPGLLVDGGYADYVVVPATALARVPDGIDPVHAGPLMCAGVTAFNALRRGGAGAGCRVAVIGIGGVGHLAIQYARHMGCETIAVSRGRGKEALALKLGAHHFIDALDPGAAGELKRLGGADVIISASSGSSQVYEFLPAVAPYGRVVVTGFSADPVRASSLDLISRNLSVMGSAAGTSMDAEETLRFSLLNGIEPVIEEFPFEAAGDAYAKMLASSVSFRAVLSFDAAAHAALPSASQPVSAVSAKVHLAGTGAAPAPDPAEVSGHRTSHQEEGTPAVPQAPALLTQQADPVLDCPADELPDIGELIEAAMQWHFSPQTGSPFWLERARQLDFEPVRDVRTLADLRLFPNVVNDLRSVRAGDLIPRGYGDGPGLLGVFESGGVTGPPKRVILLEDWMARWLAWVRRNARERRFQTGANFLMIAPTGPHLMTFLSLEGIRRRGGMAFTIDLDPRWVRRCLNEGRAEEADRYADHLIAQAAPILETQDVSILTITPPLLEKLARQPRLVELVREKITLISWGGTHMDADTRHLYRTEVFPGVAIQGGYGSTMALGGSAERGGLTDDDPCIFDPFWPYITFSVVDPESREEVPYGQRGHVVMNHISKAMFLPSNLERDTAIRVPGLPGQPGDSVADVAPVTRFDGAEVTEGVY